MKFVLRLPYAEVNVLYRDQLPGNLIIPKQMHSEKVLIIKDKLIVLP